MFAFYIAQHASRLLMNAIFGSTSLLYGSWLKLSNRTDRTNRQTVGQTLVVDVIVKSRVFFSAPRCL